MKNSGTFDSKIVNESYEYYLLKPEEKMQDAYILYVQDGKDYLTLGGLEDTFKKLLASNPYLANKMILVLIHPGSSLQRWHSYSRKGNRFNKYIQFMLDEFIPTIEEELETSNINIVKRGFLGDSLAGNVSLNIAIKNPKKCTHLLLQSAAVSKDDIQLLQDVDCLNWNVYQTVGIYEDEFISPITKEKMNILSNNRELRDMFTKKGATIQYIELEENHEWVIWKQDLSNVLDYFMMAT